MSTDVVSTTPAASLRDVIDLLTARGITGLPVTDPDGHVLGVVSEADILATTARLSDSSVIADLLVTGGKADPKLSAQTAGDVMSSPARVIDENSPLTRAAAEMLEHGIKRLPVVRGRKLVGIVTRRDLLRAFTRSDDEIAREIRDEVLARLLGRAPTDVAVHVEAGMVVLLGQVDTRTEAKAIEELVRRVPGVVSVTTSIGWKADDRVPHPS